MNTQAPELTLEAALFDLDGTLLDTPRAIAEQLAAAVREVTGSTPSVGTAQALVGRPLPELCATLAEVELADPWTSRIMEAYRHLYRTKVVPAAASLVFPGVVAGLTQLHRRGVVMAVVTSKQSDSAKLILEASGLDKFFSAVIGFNDTVLPKPHADPALLALKRLSLGPHAAVMVGDTVHDVSTAAAVPMRAIAVTYGVGKETDLRRLNPMAVATSFGAVTDEILTLRYAGKEQL